MTNEQLVIRIKSNNSTADNMSQLYEQTRQFIHYMAIQYKGKTEIEDLEQEGYLALYPAIDGYKPEKGYKLLTYAEHWIKQYMTRYIQNNGTVRIPVHEDEKIRQYNKLINTFWLHYGKAPSRHEIACYMNIPLSQVKKIEKAAEMQRIGSLDSYLTEEGGNTIADMIADNNDIEGSVTDAIEYQQLKDILWTVVDTLPDNQPNVIKMRYLKNMTLNQIGEQINRTIESVRSIETKALRELRKPKRCNMLRPFAAEYIRAFAFHGCGVETFNRTWTSSTERTAIRMAEYQKSIEKFM